MYVLVLFALLWANAAADSNPHCAYFLDYCDFNASTSSCTFQTSTRFSCGPLPVSSAPPASSNGTNATGTVAPTPAPTLKVPAPSDYVCQWAIAGDLVVAKDVSIGVDGDDCLVQVSAGKAVHLQSGAQLNASSMSLGASFVRLEENSRVSSQYSGVYRGKLGGNFHGRKIIGASNGGSGGRRVIVNESIAMQNDAFGYFDVRPWAITEGWNSTERGRVLRQSSASWNLEELWDQTPPPSSADMVDGNEWKIQMLLGSGSSNSTLASHLPGQSISGNVQQVSGGGRIKITASRDIVVMSGASIQANGAPAVSGISGGSGGSVYVSSTSLMMSGTIEAKGGAAFCSDHVDTKGIDECYPGGGGGRVMISYSSSQLDDDAVITVGGSLDDTISQRLTKWLILRPLQVRALAGGAGTYYRIAKRADGSDESSLVISNRMQASSQLLPAEDPYKAERGGAVTPVSVEGPSKLSTMVVVDGAAVSTSLLQFQAGTLNVANNSCLMEELTRVPVEALNSSLIVDVKSMVLTLHSKLLLPKAHLQVKAATVSLDTTVEVAFSNSAQFTTTGTLHTDATIRTISVPMQVPSSATYAALALQTSRALVFDSHGDILVGGAIDVGALSLRSMQSINASGIAVASNAASMSATYKSCKEHLASDDLVFQPFASTIGNFTMVVTAQERIDLGGNSQHTALLEAGAILLCSQSDMKIFSSAIVSANGMGELANQGPGSGYCSASVGGGAGYGGRGADSTAVNKRGDYASGGLPYGTRSGAGMLGSGGGCVGGGSGGGVVLIGAETLRLDGEIHCNGDGGSNGGGGGSGGFLGLSVSQFLTGGGKMSAVGGGTTCIDTGVRLFVTEVDHKCGGGGGGGRLQLTGCEQSHYDRCTSGFEGNYTVAGGAVAKMTKPGTAEGSAALEELEDATGDSGTFFGFPCAPGYGGFLCRMCKVGTFKAVSSSEECKPCANAPTNAHYIAKGETSSNCEWACDPGYSGAYCLSPLQQFLNACGGEVGFAGVLFGITLFFILLGYACRSRKEPSYRRMYNTAGKGERQHLLASAVGQSRGNRFLKLFTCVYWPRVRYPKLQDQDLPEHMARLYFSGSNEPDSPLRLRMTVPSSLKNVLYDEEFRRLAERINRVLAWRSGCLSSWSEIMYYVVALVCYPFASEVMAYRRHTRLNALKRLIAKYNHACMKGPRARALLNAVKLGYSAEYALVYLELLHKESSQSVCVPTTHIGKPSLPLVLLFAGKGTYYNPYYLDPNDLLVRSIPQCPELTSFIDEPWIEFVAELNELLRVVQRDAELLVESLLPVAQFLERQLALATKGNGRLGGLRIYLGRFYVQDESEWEEEFKLGLLLTTADDEGQPIGSDFFDESQRRPRQRAQSTSDSSIAFTANSNPNVASGRKYGAVQTDHFGLGFGGYDQGYGYSSHFPNSSGRDANDNSFYYSGDKREQRFTANDLFLADFTGQTPNVSSGSVLPTMGRKGSSDSESNGKQLQNSSIREEALRIRSSTSDSFDNEDPSNGSITNTLASSTDQLDAPAHPYIRSPATKTRNGRNSRDYVDGKQSASKAQMRLETSASQAKPNGRRRRMRSFYEAWLGPVDASLPVPGVLISADELNDRLADMSTKQKIRAFIKRRLKPRNVHCSSWLRVSWALTATLLVLLMSDLTITMAILINLRCVTDGEINNDCTAGVLIPVLLIPPFTLVIAPIMGTISLALSSTAFSRRFSLWNALSMVNVGVAIVACWTQSSRLVAPWFTRPVPFLPVIAMGVKMGEAYVIERYIAFQETYRRRRGWRGLMKRRLSDASIPPDSP